MKKQIVLFTIGLGLLSIGSMAQHDHSKMSQQDHGKITAPYDVPASFQSQLVTVYSANLSLNEAFVSSEVSKVKRTVGPVKDAISSVDMKLLAGDAHIAWTGYLKALNTNLDNMERAESIEGQRQYFAAFNQDLYQSIKAFGINGKEAYYQYCPMANGSKGAHWLSDSKEIRNPYLGDKMLTCGAIKETIN